jgi:hypothetical protein
MSTLIAPIMDSYLEELDSVSTTDALYDFIGKALCGLPLFG